MASQYHRIIFNFLVFKGFGALGGSVLNGRRLLCRRDYFKWRETTVLQILLYATIFQRDRRQISLIILGKIW